VPSTAQLPQLINVFGMQGRLGEVSETNHLRDEQGIPRICFGLTDTQDLGIGIFDEPSAEQEDKSALMKKFLESVSRWDDYTTASRYGWIEGIGDQRLVRVLKRLSISEKELLTKYCIEDKTQQEIASEMGLSQRSVGKQLQQLKKYFKKF
jgi:sigma-70, region 4